MKNAYLEFPKYIDVDLIDSPKFKYAIFQESFIKYLREVYQENSNDFFNLRDECLLRGIEFSNEIRSNHFPALFFQPQSIIVVEEDQEHFRKIDNLITGISVFLNRYNVNSDFFFNFVSIEGLAYVLKKDPGLLNYHLKQIGFNIVPVEDVNVSNNENFKQQFQKKQLPVEIIQEDLNDLQNSNLNTALDNVPLNELFYGGKYLSFILYCENEGVEKFSQLNVDIVDNFKHMRNVGVTKFQNAKNRYKELLEDISVGERNGNLLTENQKPVNDVYDYFCNNSFKTILELNEINYLNYLDDIYSEEGFARFDEYVAEMRLQMEGLLKEANRRLAIKKIEKNIEKIQTSIHYPLLSEMKWKDVARILLIPLKEADENDYFYEVIHNEELNVGLTVILYQLSKYEPLEERLKKIPSALSVREREVIGLRQQNQTLEVIGEILGVTRERIRQIEATALRKLKNYLKENYFDLYLEHLVSKSGSFTVTALFEMFNVSEELRQIVLYYISKNDDFFIEQDRIVNKNYFEFLNRLKDNISLNYQDIIDANGLFEIVNQDEQFRISMENLDVLTSSLNYYRKNDLYIKETIKLPAKIQYIFKHKIDGRLEITDDNFEKLQSLMIEVFGAMFENGKRAAVARIRDTQNVILVDGNTFMYYDLDTIPEELISEIETILLNELSTTNMTTAEILYNKYRDLWLTYDIENKIFLYSIIQYYFDTEYRIGHGNSLSISVLGNKNIDLYSILYEYLENNGNVAPKSQVLNDLHWQTYKLEQLIARHDNLISVELEDKVAGVKLFTAMNATSEELQKLHTFVNEFITDDYVFPNDLMIEMEFDDELSDILAKFDIHKLYDFASLLKYLDKDFRGFHQFLYKKGSKYNSVEKVIREMYPNIISRKDLVDFIEEKGFAESTISSLITDLLSFQYYYPYTSYQYINANIVQIDDTILEDLRKYLDNSFGDKIYISALDLVGFTNLPRVSSYPWTPQLIAHFSEQIGFKIINTTRDYRYDKLLLVKVSSGIKKLDELAYHLIITEYKGNYHENMLAKFLVDKKLLHSPSISYELRSSELFVFKELGFVELKGE
ncbi:sigma factor-like helix-turn-helix DNA-binding protein [Lysinibacillus xylanilyticus]|uniref:sigma factor-like helix-turn-helix DNA-binding protein n=1 Tax=Lysinibacillus xylanilyticus TaxID=582475 RepID=UPI003D01DDA5